MDEMTKKSMAKINNHFCGLHMLVNLAELCNAVLKEFEQTETEQADVDKTSEAGSLRLVRTACKAFERHGSEKAGRMVDFATYAATKGVEKLPLTSFRGNRFNVIFYDVAGVYFLAPVMSEYCSFAERNRLLDAVAADLNEIHYLTGCRALGIVGKIVTAPLWRFLVSDAPFSDVAGVYQSLTQSFGAWAGDASDLLDGCACPFPGAKLHKDSVVWDALFTPCEKDAKTRQLLQLLCTAFHAYMTRAWSAYLDGGEHSTTTDSLPKTNILSEHDFGQLDRFLQEKPSATTLAIEAMIMMENHNTMHWLAAKSPEDRSSILQEARWLVPRHRQLAKARGEAARQYRLLQIQKQQAQKKRREELRARRVQKATEDISNHGGLWITRADVEKQLKNIPAPQQRKALQAQLRFRKHVMHQQAPGRLFVFSKAKQQLSVEELKTNLISLINRMPGSAEETFSDDTGGR